MQLFLSTALKVVYLVCKQRCICPRDITSARTLTIYWATEYFIANSIYEPDFRFWMYPAYITWWFLCNLSFSQRVMLKKHCALLSGLFFLSFSLFLSFCRKNCLLLWTDPLSHLSHPLVPPNFNNEINL